MTVKELIQALLDEDLDNDVVIEVAGSFWGIVPVDGISAVSSQRKSRTVLAPDADLMLKP
ncbi:MAG: hypothetical protein IPN65_03965 [Elusimicrobia bacterium]|nr:hypothetical protein [Elusimicrobiota bacterium]MBK7546217.1 hypothetical protein [Elusimicrobiota bacterium]MBK7575783.1 hypothetical protein [Elusimicrobiota bacterium]MBK8652210.1 hypothetical protein [Elusimicrobiota bacterium]MBK9058128.1 hypothetical protein [Elusimicrobiota bacterium]